MIDYTWIAVQILFGAFGAVARFGVMTVVTPGRWSWGLFTVNMGGSLLVVAQSVKLARKTLRVVKQNLVWAAAYNAVCVPLAALGWLPAWLAGLGMALSSLWVVVNALRLTRGF